MTRTKLAVLSIVLVGPACGVDNPVAPPPPPPVPDHMWPHEPANFVALSDYGFEDSIPVTSDPLSLGRSGWFVQWNPLGNGSRSADDRAPVSPPFVYQVKYPIGFVSGLAPSTLQFYLTPDAPELYLGFWWKPSDPFQSDGSGVNKIVFLWTHTASANSADLLYFDFTPNPWRIRVMNDLIAGGGPTAGTRLEPNLDTAVVALAQWHRIEIYARYSSADAANGVLKWWVDGVLNGSYANLKMPPDAGFRYLQVAPTFGGNTGDVKLETDYYWFDQLHVSRPRQRDVRAFNRR